VPRALSLYLPLWSIDLVRRRAQRSASPDGCLFLTTDVAQRRLIARCCERSARAGVRPGMDLTHARALLPPGPVRAGPYQPERDLAALHSLALWATRFSPLVAPDPPDGLFLDITGCERVFRGEERLLHAVADGARRLGLHARAAAGPSFGCAWAVARFGAHERSVTPDALIRQTIAPLPIAALRIGEQARAALAEVGIDRIGHVLDLPRAALPSRFGPELLLRLDQALGQALETIEPVRPIDPPSVERQFDGPTTQYEAIELTVHDLLTPLTDELRRRESGVRRLDLTLTRVDAPPERLWITLSRPGRSPAHLWSLLRPRLERVNLGFGVDHISMTAARTARLRHEQAGALGARVDEVPPDRALAELTDILVNRLGPDRVGRVDLAESHIPERRGGGVAYGGTGLRPVEFGRSRDAGIREMHRPEACATVRAILAADRPSLLLDRPEPAAAIAITPDGPPSLLRWRGRELPVVAAIGPERIGCEWWRAAAPARDYFKIQSTSGRWLWTYHEPQTNHWFVHGEWV